MLSWDDNNAVKIHKGQEFESGAHIMFNLSLFELLIGDIWVQTSWPRKRSCTQILKVFIRKHLYCDVKVSQRWHIEDYYQKLLNKMPKPLPNFDDVSVVLAKVILCNSCICLFPHFNWSDIYLPSNKGMLQLYRVNLRFCCLPCIHRSKCSGHV